MDLKELALVDPNVHWYYQSKLSVLRRALRRWPVNRVRILDVGAGSGFLARRLAESHDAESVVCVDPNYEDDVVEHDGLIRLVRKTDALSIQSASVLLFIDVLEHVADDVALLRSYVNHAAPGSTVLITVPAFMSLWSNHDEFLEHYRRYRLPQLRDVALQAGLEVLHRRYLFASIFPAVWLVRRLRRNRSAASDLDSIPRPLNSLLTFVLSAEHRITWNRLFGVSAFLVARVPERHR